MASKLKIIPLGGLGEIGKNLTVYEYGKDIIRASRIRASTAWIWSFRTSRT